VKGTYVLVIKLENRSLIGIGRLGNLDFPKGCYCYVGSAFGKSMNLENRIRRYERLNKEKEGKLKWHIDYFLVNPHALIEKVVAFNEEKIECEISCTLSKHAKMSIEGFGCSDCECKSHFHYFGKAATNSLLKRLHSWCLKFIDDFVAC